MMFSIILKSEKMPVFISLMRVREAVLSLREWRSRVDSQGAKHLIHFLASKKGGVNAKTFVDYAEADDFTYCDEALKVRSGDNPYYDPLDGEFRIASHPHSNIATARKKTFSDGWKAAITREDGGKEQWKFAPEYLGTLRTKMLTKAGIVTLIPIYDLCAWLYRSTSFPDNVSLEDVVNKFKSDHNFEAAEFDSLFSTKTLSGQKENAKAYFTEHKTGDSMLLEMLKDPVSYDLSDAIAEAFSKTDQSPVTENDVVTLLTKGRKQLVLQGPPGTGKTYLAKRAAGKILGLDLASAEADKSLRELFVNLNEDIEAITAKCKASGGWTLVQFHPSYTYEDFVRGLAPELKDGGQPTFTVQDRSFAKICEAARRIKPKPMIMIVDEINRGDLSKVLGELIYALEYREEPVALQYAKRGEAAFSVPDNLCIVATLNTADRSITNIDYAIRRRFDFITLNPDRTVIERAHSESPVKDGVLALFDSISRLLENARDNAVGHSYFLATNPDALAQSIVFQVLPLLTEYRLEGLLGESDSVYLPRWPGKSGLPLSHERPFELANSLATWLETYSGSDGTSEANNAA